jgi:hypothetical protein
VFFPRKTHARSHKSPICALELESPGSILSTFQKRAHENIEKNRIPRPPTENYLSLQKNKTVESANSPKSKAKCARVYCAIGKWSLTTRALAQSSLRYLCPQYTKSLHSCSLLPVPCCGASPKSRLSRLVGDASGSPLPTSTPCGDIQQKNRHAIFSGVETSMKMTFHAPDENQRAVRRRREPLSKTPLLFFHYENVFRKNRKDKP